MTTATTTQPLNAHERRAILLAATEAINGTAGHSHLFTQIENIIAGRTERAALIEPAVPLRFAQHLAYEAIDNPGYSRCELTDTRNTPDGRSHQCPNRAVAVRWEDGYADAVCQTHADTATERGAVVVYAKRHTGEG